MKIKKFNKILIFLFLIYIMSSCGIPNINTFDDLNTPTGLVEVEYIAGNNIRITFNCYNYEQYFLGYNIYIVDNSDSSINQLSTLVNNHITINDDGFFERDYNIENNYIIKNSNYTIPSITYDEVLAYYKTNYDSSIDNLYDLCEESEDCTYKLKPFEYEFNITKLPDNSNLNVASNYKIVISAYGSDGFNYFESNASNQINTSE